MNSVVSRDTVFVAGGQPSITYVDRKQLDIERQLARAIATPNQIVSLSGPTKSGKTVLCRHVLGERQYVWIEGGQAPAAKEVWERVCYELNMPGEVTKENSTTTGIEIGGKLWVVTTSGSRLSVDTNSKTYRLNSMSSAINHLLKNNIALIIDDFHYLEESERVGTFALILVSIYVQRTPLEYQPA